MEGVLLILGICFLIGIMRGGGSSSSGSRSRSSRRSKGFTKVIQRGDKIQAYHGNNYTMFDGRLQGWSTQTITFTTLDGRNATYSYNGGYEYHY